MSTSGDRPRGGRRPEDFPEARALDDLVLGMLRTGRETRNELAGIAGVPKRKVSYALHRLRSRGLVRRIPRGNEGHGYWESIEEGD
jgi:uncharacterized membrane protein